MYHRFMLKGLGTALAFTTTLCLAESKPWPINTWLFSSSHGNGDGLQLATSDDGKAWKDMGKVFIKPEVGSKLMRDPHILRGPDGMFRMVWTSGWRDKGIGYAVSSDLAHWSAQRYLPFPARTPGARNAWAPETAYDELNQQYVITWSSDIDGRPGAAGSPRRMNSRTYYVTTRDFETFSEPRLLLDPGFDHAGTTIARVGNRYVAIFQERDGGKGRRAAIRWAVAEHILGPYALAPESLIPGRPAASVTLVDLGDKVRLYVDFDRDDRYGAYESHDLTTWTEVSSQVSVPPGQRHGSIISIPAWLGLEAAAAAPGATPVTPQPAPPPVLEGFTADPAIRVFGDTYYLYPTSDKPNWQTTDFSVWSSKNLVDWRKEGMVLDVARDLKWANIRAWAPDAIERDGRYYFYFCAQGKIGVAVGSSPRGPFVDALGKPLIEKGGKVTTPQTIDPYPFIDDDGQAYLYFGNGKYAQVFKLKPDMVTLDGDPVDIPMQDFREGVVVFKRGGKYYFMWSIDDARSPNYRVGWGMSDSPFGPVTPGGPNFIVLQRNGPAVGTAHHSVVNVPGTDRWYVAYHRHALPDGNGYKRQTVLARMQFDAGGAILPMDPLKPAFHPGAVGEPLVNGKGR